MSLFLKNGAHQIRMEVPSISRPYALDLGPMLYTIPKATMYAHHKA